jgi:hypothetical protein
LEVRDPLGFSDYRHQLADSCCQPNPTAHPAQRPKIPSTARTSIFRRLCGLPEVETPSHGEKRLRPAAISCHVSGAEDAIANLESSHGSAYRAHYACEFAAQKTAASRLCAAHAPDGRFA